MTEVSHAWLDRVVTAQQRMAAVRRSIASLRGLTACGDLDDRRYAGTDAEEILDRDGTSFRLAAVERRLASLERDLDTSIACGSSVGAVLNGLTELEETLTETILNTEALLSDIGVIEDPFVDRLEEHPAYERS